MSLTLVVSIYLYMPVHIFVSDLAHIPLEKPCDNIPQLKTDTQAQHLEEEVESIAAAVETVAINNTNANVFSNSVADIQAARLQHLAACLEDEILIEEEMTRSDETLDDLVNVRGICFYSILRCCFRFLQKNQDLTEIAIHALIETGMIHIITPIQIVNMLH